MVGYPDYRFVKKWLERHLPAPLTLWQPWSRSRTRQRPLQENLWRVNAEQEYHEEK